MSLVRQVVRSDWYVICRVILAPPGGGAELYDLAILLALFL